MVRREKIIATITRSARFATNLTPWLLVVLGLLGKLDFSKPVWVLETAAISWIVYAVVGVLFDAVLCALRRAFERALGQK